MFDAVRSLEDADAVDSRVVGDHALDLGWCDLFAAAVDQVLDSSGDRQIAICVEAPGIAGAIPAVDERPVVQLGIVQVTVHHAWTARDDFALFTDS